MFSRTDRLADHAAELAGRTDERATIVALRVLGIPVEQLGGGEHFESRLGERLALFLRHCPGNDIGSLAQQRCRLVQDRAAFLDVGVAPLRPGSRACR